MVVGACLLAMAAPVRADEREGSRVLDGERAALIPPPPSIVKAATGAEQAVFSPADSANPQGADAPRSPEVATPHSELRTPNSKQGADAPRSPEATPQAADAPRSPTVAVPLAPLEPRGLALVRPGTSDEGSSPGRSAGPLVTAMGSLAVVLALFFAAVWLMRRHLPAGATRLPEEVVEVLGRAPLAGKQQMQLLRCGRKLLLVCLSPVGVETLTEIDEPSEVDRLTGLCREAHPKSAAAAFRQVLHEMGSEPAPRGLGGAGRRSRESGRLSRPARPREDHDVY